MIVGSALLAASIYICYGFADRLAELTRHHRNERYYAAFVILAGLHRRPDFLEWRELIASHRLRRALSAKAPLVAIAGDQ